MELDLVKLNRLRSRFNQALLKKDLITAETLAKEIIQMHTDAILNTAKQFVEESKIIKAELKPKENESNT